MLKSLYNEVFCNFNSPITLTIINKKMAISNRFLQLFIFGFLVYDLLLNELYLKREVPSGYTTMWAESGNLYELQEQNHYSYCNNNSYNYIWASPDWEYTNISCKNLHYSESYIKGENEIFFLTYYSDKNTFINNSCNSDFRLINSIKNKTICENNQNYFTTGIEGMVLAFDHFYTTSFMNGGNIGSDGKQIKTIIEDCNGNEKYIFYPGKTIKMNISEWLKLACISLDDYNTGTIKSVDDDSVVNINYPFNRITGIDIIFKINYFNLKSITNTEHEECIIRVTHNYGWASKGSHLTYIKYPKKKLIYHFIDRYKYGIKFKFIVSGLMGIFDFNLLISHFVSGVVLINISSKIIAFVGSKYYKSFAKSRVIKEKIDSDEDDNDSINSNFKDSLSNSDIEEINLEIINNNSVTEKNEIHQRFKKNETML